MAFKKLKSWEKQVQSFQNEKAPKDCSLGAKVILWYMIYLGIYYSKPLEKKN